MLQLIQHQKTGKIISAEVPAPKCPKNGVLVKVSHSIISAGTEKTTVSKAKSSLIERAKKQPEDVKLVLDYIKKEGIHSTYRRIKSALNSYKALGYSASGIVIETTVEDFSVGDRVAVAGAGLANHAEIVAIPKNLAVKIPAEVSYHEAAYTTIGAIAMQGVRQANVRIGDNIAVIGLGLIGIITVQLLKANGCRVAGFDLNDEALENARKFGSDQVFESSFNSIKSAIAFTRGHGFDSVIITAGTSSNQPVELAMELARKKGIAVAVGAIGMDIPRPPFFKKEIDFRIASSYGPGRYDPNYEEKGIDYPYAYVRYTENRNMQAFLDLIQMKKIDVESMTTHEYDLENAEDAYELVLGNKKEKFLGIILKYNKYVSQVRYIELKRKSISSDVTIGFVGAGTFAQNYLMPPLLKLDVSLRAVATESSVNSKTVADKFGFKAAATDYNEIINKDEINTIFIATRHDSHAEIVIQAIKNKKNIFVEKPLCINYKELLEIDFAMQENPTNLMVGFNRRFSEDIQQIKKFIENHSDPLNMLYRVNAGYIPKEHWTQHENQGGRIIGEVCHFIDTMAYLCDALPKLVYAKSISTANESKVDFDDVMIVIKFEDGSLGSVLYTASGDKSLPKEYLEVYCENKTAIMHNFEKVELYNAGIMKVIKTGKGKGIAEEVNKFVESIKKEIATPISYGELRAITLATFAANISLRNNQEININEITQ